MFVFHKKALLLESVRKKFLTCLSFVKRLCFLRMFAKRFYFLFLGFAGRNKNGNKNELQVSNVIRKFFSHRPRQSALSIKYFMPITSITTICVSIECHFMPNVFMLGVTFS